MQVVHNCQSMKSKSTLCTGEKKIDWKKSLNLGVDSDGKGKGRRVKAFRG